MHAKQSHPPTKELECIIETNSLDKLKNTICSNYLVDESECIKSLITLANPSNLETLNIKKSTISLVEKIRTRSDANHIIDRLLQQFSLSTHEGILLMCLAESLIRIPDKKTAEELISNKLSSADWKHYLSQSDSMLVNFSTWGLMITGKVVSPKNAEQNTPTGIFNRLVKKMGEPIARAVISQAMKIIGKHFIIGRTIGEALVNARECFSKGYRYSFDMLGEAAITKTDAQRYFEAYMKAIEIISKQNNSKQAASNTASISIKLSALHPRYESLKRNRVMSELFDLMLHLIQQAKSLDVEITIDAEEADRLIPSIDLFEKLLNNPDCKGWGKLGIVVQAYSKRALPTLIWLNALAKKLDTQIPVRLVKGAYWDSEIKWAQEKGLSEYPVFTRKENTDISYLACARFLLSKETDGYLRPQFATHNAHTVSSILVTAETQKRDIDAIEFQRLHGMGNVLYNTLKEQQAVHIRIYAPVGSHQDLLPYLVRRLLENGANSSFVHRLTDSKTPVELLAVHPIDTLKKYASLRNERIPLPQNIYPDRKNSKGTNLQVDNHLKKIQADIASYREVKWHIPDNNPNNGKSSEENLIQVYDPSQANLCCGSYYPNDIEFANNALKLANDYFPTWNQTPIEDRALLLNKLADALEENQGELIALCQREAGKCLQDALDEIREAVDFCRYYAVIGQQYFAHPTELNGPTGECNTLSYSGRGVFLCISPWNFPLAIFLGQIVAALIAGNTVIAKPAETTSLIAIRTVDLMLRIGFPSHAIQLVLGKGSTIGTHLVADPRIAGVTFTGSTHTAHHINKRLAEKAGPIVPFIAETGGQNAMIVDSTALPEQIVQDVIHSAFTSAGQRCSALRVLYLQQDIAGRVTELLKGAMLELKVGLSQETDTDIGPVINASAKKQLTAHIDQLKSENRLIGEANLNESCNNGHFVAPVAFKIDHINQLKKEHFGPILHVIYYKKDQLNQVIQDINNTGFGLTLGIHSRNEDTTALIAKHANVGNIYVNRNQIGAVVGVQPFGGCGLSGTGPKAGGPLYLYRFVTERTLTVNTTAVGGNASLLSNS